MAAVPLSLRRWFLFHFVIDLLFAIPLLFFPAWLLGLFGIVEVQFVTARLVGAALLGIGGASLLMHREGVESFHAMLLLKIVWSLAALVALGLSLWEGAPSIVWLLFAIFLVFNLVWIYYYRKLK